jgi:hypothetical protein
MSASARTIFWTFGHWLGVELLALLAPISVGYDHPGGLVQPARHAVSALPVAWPLSSCVTNAPPTTVEGLRPAAAQCRGMEPDSTGEGSLARTELQATK